VLWLPKGEQTTQYLRLPTCRNNPPTNILFGNGVEHFLHIGMFVSVARAERQVNRCYIASPKSVVVTMEGIELSCPG
jgi:hypothetical protein